MIHEFDAALEKLEGRIQWTVFYVPFSVEEVYGTRGRVKIRATIDGHDFAGTLLPSRNGHYMVYNKQLRTACGKDLGEKVHVVLERDIEPRTVAVPGELLEELRRHPAALEAFERLPYYRKREEVNKILDAKRQATRERRLQKLIEVLGDRDG